MSISDWISDDGPLVCLPAAGSERWLGVWRDARAGEQVDDTIEGRAMVLDPEIDPGTTDYAHACAALGPGVVAALVAFEGGTALALETTGHQAAFVPTARGVIVAKWIFAPDVPLAEQALVALDPASLEWERVLVWKVPAGGIVLTPAAERGGSLVSCDIAAGTYDVSYTTHSPDPETSFELFALERAG